MLRWTLIFLVVAVVAGAFGFGGIAAAAADFARILFFIFLVLLIASVVLGISGSVMRQVLSLALPIAALLGGGIAGKSGIAGGLLMVASAVGILLVLEIGVVSLITSIPIGLGGVLALIAGFSEGGA
jgi:uncharacterized membrane protein YtjA (UPF0391 family)